RQRQNVPASANHREAAADDHVAVGLQRKGGDERVGSRLGLVVETVQERRVQRTVLQDPRQVGAAGLVVGDEIAADENLLVFLDGYRVHRAVDAVTGAEGP